MELSMKDQSKMSYQPSLLNLTDVISLQELQPGTTHSPQPDGVTETDRSGPDHVLANLSARQAKERGLLTSGTYGLRGSTLSSSAGLASSLASKFRQRTQCLGSTLFTLTWKVRYTPSGRPIFAVRASGHRISGKDCTSWPTPQTADENLSRGLSQDALEREWNRPNRSQNLAITAQYLTTWPTPTAVNREDSIEKRAERGKKYGFGTALTLNMAAELVSWATPTANDHKGSGPTTERKDGKIRNDRLDHQTEQFGPAQLTDFGETPSGSIAATESTGPSGQLNPGHSRWLMSLPPIWDICGIRAADAIRSRRSSKKAGAASSD